MVPPVCRGDQPVVGIGTVADPRSAGMLISTREVAQAQQRLVAAIADLDDDDLRVDSQCPGWTRGHVLSHIARNGEGMANLARWVLEDEVVPMYAPGRRDPDIEDGAQRGADEIRADIAATNVVALDALGELEGAVATDPLVAERAVRLGGDPERGPQVYARRLPLLRLQEVVLHHHDLDLGLRPSDWLQEWVDTGLPYLWVRMAPRLENPPTLRRSDREEQPVVEPTGSHVEVRGSGADLLAWVTGRAAAADLARLDVTPAGAALPDLPDL